MVGIGVIGVLVVGLFLAYANGANDNFKGVATLFGSKTSDYKGALIWATVATALGSIAALILAKGLILTFSGKGLVPDSIVSLKSFALSVSMAAALTLFFATRLGLPISTTHAIVGALVGAGLAASPSDIHLGHLRNAFFMPLLASPLLAALLTIFIQPPLGVITRMLGIKKETCVCIGTEVVGVVPAGISHQEAILSLSSSTSISMDSTAACVERYGGDVLGLRVGAWVDRLHYLSAGAVSFARGLNDTPKIAALLLAGSVFHPSISILGVGIFIAVGGLISARRVAETLSRRITDMNHAQGLTANLVTSALVIFASRLGMPVSTTHVSCGALFGLGTITGQVKWKMIGAILLSWIFTLPVAAILGGLFFECLKGVIS